MLSIVKTPVLQLNASFEVLGRLTFNHAVTHLVTMVPVIIDGKTVIKPKAYVFESIPDRFVYGPPTADGSERRRLPWPVCITMERYARLHHDDVGTWDDDLVMRSAILARDGFQCMYCAKPGSTWDHIIPESRGGPQTWWNLTTACVACNSFKRDRTPEEAGMKLLRQPFKPVSNKHARDQKRVYRLLAAA